jgi:hypothetical protein
LKKLVKYQTASSTYSEAEEAEFKYLIKEKTKQKKRKIWVELYQLVKARIFG